MAKQRTASPSRTMKPVFLIFCEGETEEAYLDYLKQAYRSPIRIVPKIEGDSISQEEGSENIEDRQDSRLSHV